jgi:hypothetical protein
MDATTLGLGASSTALPFALKGVGEIPRSPRFL